MTLVYHGKRIRIRWGARTKAAPQVTAAQQNFALALSALLAPCALVAFTLTCWCVAADLGWTANFFITRGAFSHWQSWFVSSIVLLLVSRLLAQFVE